MSGLLSGLPNHVADDEELARILRSSSHFNTLGAKASAFMPARDGMTSVIRHGSEPREQLWRLAQDTLGADISVHGAAILRVKKVREQDLDVLPEEPPPRHANIVGWPMSADPELQRAQQREIALVIAAGSTVITRERK